MVLLNERLRSPGIRAVMPLRVQTPDNIGVILQDVNLLNELLLLLNIARSSPSMPRAW